MMDTKRKIEAILFWKGEPVSLKELITLTKVSSEEVGHALEMLEGEMRERGIVLMKKDDMFLFATHPDTKDTIESLLKEDKEKDLGKAGLETLALVLYDGPISRADIDYVRGVNSAFILRHLLIRGLIERIPNPNDKRAFLYQPTFELLSHLGVSNIQELADFSSIKDEIRLFKFASHEDNNGKEHE